MPSVLDFLAQYFPVRKSIPHGNYYPAISGVSITTGGLVTWTTNLTSTSQVFYGLTPYLGSQTARDSTYVTSHSVQLSGLTSGKLYYVQVQSFNQDSLSVSPIFTFTSA